MYPFSFTKAANISDALNAGGRYIAGGTTLVDLMRETVERPETLVDISALPLREVTVTAGGGLRIGALVSIAACNKRQPGSGCAALDGYNRGHAILGTSDACVATHPSDVAVAFAALEASVRLLGPDGERDVPFADFLLQPGTTPDREQALRPGELITAVEVPTYPRPLRSGYLKVRDRQSYEFALTSAAVALHVRGGVVRQAKVAAGGVGTVPWRLSAVEQQLIGKRPSEQLWSDAAARAADGARPLAHNGFKVELLRRTVERQLRIVGGGK
jgi:xanthine dehydrogenase YagS FAD-binding subunit